MNSVRWNRRRGSWHLAWSGESPRTLCGRSIPDLVPLEVREEIPYKSATCSQCLLIAERRRELQERQDSVLDDVPVVPV
jgi:hypothetical protein